MKNETLWRAVEIAGSGNKLAAAMTKHSKKTVHGTMIARCLRKGQTLKTEHWLAVERATDGKVKFEDFAQEYKKMC